MPETSKDRLSRPLLQLWQRDHEVLCLHNPDSTPDNYDFDRLEKDLKRVAETLNATNPDLSAFRERGGKL